MLAPQPPDADEEDNDEDPQAHDSYLYEVDEDEAAFAQTNEGSCAPEISLCLLVL